MWPCSNERREQYLWVESSYCSSLFIKLFERKYVPETAPRKNSYTRKRTRCLAVWAEGDRRRLSQVRRPRRDAQDPIGPFVPARRARRTAHPRGLIHRRPQGTTSRSTTPAGCAFNFVPVFATLPGTREAKMFRFCWSVRLRLLASDRCKYFWLPVLTKQGVLFWIMLKSSGCKSDSTVLNIIPRGHQRVPGPSKILHN
jgi:hypothetical protein